MESASPDHHTKYWCGQSAAQDRAGSTPPGRGSAERGQCKAGGDRGRRADRPWGGLRRYHHSLYEGVSR